MAKTFGGKIAELELKKSELLELDIDFLQSQKKEYEEKMYEILDNLLDNRNTESDKSKATSELNKAAPYHVKIREINKKIQEKKLLEDIDKKILFYQERKERVKDIPLYKNTEEGITEILGGDPVYLYAKETKKEKLVKKLKERTLKENEYHMHLENMYKELLKTYEKKKKEAKQDIPKKVEILLPEGMSEQIKEELEGNKDINPKEIERFLKNELKNNNGEIKLSHIKNKFKDNYNQAYQYIKRLIINYQGFKIIENSDSKSSFTPIQTKRDKLISSISSEESEEHKNERLRKNNLILKLNEILKIDDLKVRIPKYLDLFEELNCNFANREEFEPQLLDVITTHTHIEMEKEIIKTLNLLIHGKPRTEKTGLYKYNVYKFNRDSWRMLAYPNGEIFTICPHEEYEKIINTQPPIDKTE